ncbi:carboxylate--amine ligase [Sporosarcina sp. P21c]|uniref:ATP-grasp fold amidoligase family protein n=1 Tax=Sporosarcina sp. P21c TaxID=2048255 RepID=UPI000C163800|nr:ATP-grasp fold amidoligase family protein [Sporosarcina sp. P21c]PIC90898.1 carboxylate--amine ligase [Sporosarcina sp. P21c]
MLKEIKYKIKIFSLRYSFTDDIYIFFKMLKDNFLKIFSDEKYSELYYKSRTGKKLNIANPTTFNEKIWWLKLNNRDPLLTLCTDKIKAREYVKECGLEHILSEIDSVYERVSDIRFSELPEKAYIKTNHGSGTIKLWDKSAPFDKKRFAKEFNRSLKQNYYWKSREWNYKNIKPMIVVENIIGDGKDNSLIDYRFLCFDGVVKMIFVDKETAAEDGSHNPHAKRNVYDRNFNYLDIEIGRDQFDRSIIKKPVNFEKMIDYAEVLSKPFPFCRVDFYNINGVIIFGEMTFSPQGGTSNIKPVIYNKIMGDWINLQSDKIVLKE